MMYREGVALETDCMDNTRVKLSQAQIVAESADTEAFGSRYKLHFPSCQTFGDCI